MRALMCAVAVFFMTIGALFCAFMLAGVVGAIDFRVCIASPSQCPTPAIPAAPVPHPSTVDQFIKTSSPVAVLNARFMRGHHLFGATQ